MATDRRNSFAAIPQLEAQLEKILKENVIFEKKVINIQEFQSDFYSEYGQYKELIAGKFSAVTADIAYLKTFEADIENLYAEAVMTNELNAKIAELGYITASSADLKYAAIGEFDAVSGRVGTLEGDFSSFVSGEFGSLKSGVANIQTLMFGSATGTTITTEFANTVVSHIGTAQIDSGMIKDLTFDKITGFDVNTTNLTIHSEDGKSTWSDNTIQISDANRVRVQIGKDASNDYSMYVWDATGNLMFDALGLTDSGIQREIIRNDMVAADAAIDGSKLNIQSVVSAIDGSTYTFSSSHLIYDGKKLDLFLGDMSETATEHGNTLSSQGTQITAIQGQIASKIWQDDIDTAASEMNAKYSNLEQNLNGFKTTVGETYSTKSDVNALTKRVETAETSISQNTEQISLRATKTEVATAKDEAINAAANQALTESKSYTDAQIQVSADNIESTVSSTYATKTENQAALDATQAVADDLANNYSTTTEMNSAIEQKANSITSSVSATYATKEALSAAETRITQTESNISSQVSETNGLKERMSTVEQTASGLEVRLTAAESDIDTAQSTTEAAAKTATNFLSYDATNGLLIGNKTSGEWSGCRSQILPTAFNILDASGNILSSFGANLIELGKNNDSATINLCNGTASFTNKNDDSVNNYKRLGINSANEVGIESENFSVSASYQSGNILNSVDISAFTHLPWNEDPNDPLTSGASSFEILSDSWDTVAKSHNQAYLNLSGSDGSAGIVASYGSTTTSITLNGMKSLINIDGDIETTGSLMLSGNISATNLTRKSVTISGLPSNAGYTCYYYPIMKMCVLRLYYTGKAVSATTTTTLGTVASSYRPSTLHALTVYTYQDTLKHRQARISSDGNINFYSEVAKDATDDIYITGFWLV